MTTLAKNQTFETEADLREEIQAYDISFDNHKREIAALETQLKVLRDNMDKIDEGLFIPPTKSEQILRVWEIFQRVEILDEKNDQLESALAECYRLTGEDCDGNEDWRIAPHAVEAVRKIRKEHDEAEKELCAYEKLIGELRTENGRLVQLLNGK